MVYEPGAGREEWCEHCTHFGIVLSGTLTYSSEAWHWAKPWYASTQERRSSRSPAPDARPRRAAGSPRGCSSIDAARLRRSFDAAPLLQAPIKGSEPTSLASVAATRSEVSDDRCRDAGFESSSSSSRRRSIGTTCRSSLHRCRTLAAAAAARSPSRWAPRWHEEQHAPRQAGRREDRGSRPRRCPAAIVLPAQRPESSSARILAAAVPSRWLAMRVGGHRHRRGRRRVAVTPAGPAHHVMRSAYPAATRSAFASTVAGTRRDAQPDHRAGPAGVTSGPRPARRRVADDRCGRHGRRKVIRFQSAAHGRGRTGRRRTVGGAPAANCDPNYAGACLDPSSTPISDCAGGAGNGPDYTGTVRVVGSDHLGSTPTVTASAAERPD